MTDRWFRVPETGSGADTDTGLAEGEAYYFRVTAVIEVDQ